MSTRRGNRIEIKRRPDGRYGWALVSRNGNLMANSAEGDGYPTPSAARRAVRSVRRVMFTSPPIVVVESADG